MILAVDAYYHKTNASVAGIAFESWSACNPISVHVSRVERVSAYVSGEFYQRELPCILALLNEHELSPGTIIIDGYVYLDGSSTPGLGKHLYDALKGHVTVVGVAKQAFADLGSQYAIVRGNSTRPLYVTAEGMVLERAKACIMAMHGKHRIPTLLKRADQESRS